MKSISRLRNLALLAAAVALGGCASLQGASTPEAAVKQRANEHWQARLSGDVAKAYTFMPPAYRAVTSLDAYKKSIGTSVELVKGEAVSVNCETSDKCVVTNRVEAKVNALARRANMPPLVTHYEDVWIRENGQWWLFPSS